MKVLVLVFSKAKAKTKTILNKIRIFLLYG